MDIARLGLRLVTGLTFVAHGSQTLFGAFGGGGIEGTGEFFESIGLRPGKPNALLAGTVELLAGSALVAGAVTPLAAAPLIGDMTAAALTANRRGFFNAGGGFEYNLVMAAAVFALAGMGAGKWSVDEALGIDLSGTGAALGALGLGVLGGLGAVISGRLASRLTRPATPRPAGREGRGGVGCGSRCRAWRRPCAGGTGPCAG